MMVGVAPCFYGFTLDGVREEAVLFCFFFDGGRSLFF